MKAHITGVPADGCTRKIVKYRNDVPFVYFIPPMSGHKNSPCPCGSGKKFKRCHGAINNDSTNH